MRLYLIRHGETDWNVKRQIQGSTDTPLNENGLRQAEELARRLVSMGLRPARIYTSPMDRAFTTARILSRALEAPCIVQPGLKEIGFGLWEGLTWDQVKERYPSQFRLWYEDRQYQRPPEGESYQELLDRVLPALRAVVQREGGPDSPADILVVSHSAIIMSLLTWLNQTPFSEMAARYRTGNAGLTQLDGHELFRAGHEDGPRKGERTGAP